ncbi:MAG: FGGY family carbohydrate kinase [Solirubrobacteraceae bacterium]
MTAVLAIDQGTTSTKALLVSDTGQIIASATSPVSRTYPRPGWVEQDPEELWASVAGVVAQLPTASVACLALSSQRESVVLWERHTGRPLSPCVSWQCNRGAEMCAALRRAGAETTVRELTGLPLDPMFSASKLRYLLQADPALLAAAESGSVCAGTVDSWLLFKLSGGAAHVTDAGNASRTLLFDIHRLEWSDELLDLFDVPAACLPHVRASQGAIAEAVAFDRLASLPVTASLADSHAAAFGLGCVQPGSAKATYGTGTSLLAPSGNAPAASRHGLAVTVAWMREEPTYALEGNVFSSGATVYWLAAVLGLPDAGAVDELAATVSSSSGVHLVPAFSGLGAPYWQPQARAAITGLTFGSGAAELARAAVESIAFQVADLVLALARDTERPLAELRVDGGATRNDALMQFQADVLGCPVIRTTTPDAAAAGAALMGGVAGGLFASDAVSVADHEWRHFEPRTTVAHRQELLAGWHAAVAEAIEREQVTVA